jgi:hypothetical protein
MLIKNYLTNQTIRVKVNSTLSKKQKVTVGLPQGSSLAPLLFIMYTNDMSLLKLHSKSWLFADDTTIAIDGTNFEVILKKLQDDLVKIVEWLNNNKLIINLKKSQIMHLPSSTQKTKLIHIPSMCKKHCNVDPNTNLKLLDENQKPIKCKKPKESIMFNGDKVLFVEKTKKLGVTIDNHLKYDSHIHEVCKKVNSKTGLLKKATTCFRKNLKKICSKYS